MFGRHHAANSKMGVSIVFFGFLPVRIIFGRLSTVSGAKTSSPVSTKTSRGHLVNRHQVEDVRVVEFDDEVVL